VGDARVKFQVALPGLVSVVAKQSGETLTAYTADAGGTIQMLATGEQTAEQMFTAAQKANTMMTWLLRGVGMLIMFIGFSLLFRPLSILADVIPFLGTIVGVGTGIVAFILSLVISLVVISVAWIFYRPVIGVILLVLACVGIFFLIKKMTGKKSQAIQVA